MSVIALNQLSSVNVNNMGHYSRLDAELDVASAFRHAPAQIKRRVVDSLTRKYHRRPLRALLVQYGNGGGPIPLIERGDV